MPEDLTADEIRALLGLEPHPTCGFVTETYWSEQRIAPGGLPSPSRTDVPWGRRCSSSSPQALPGGSTAFETRESALELVGHAWQRTGPCPHSTPAGTEHKPKLGCGRRPAVGEMKPILRRRATSLFFPRDRAAVSCSRPICPSATGRPTSQPPPPPPSSTASSTT